MDSRCPKKLKKTPCEACDLGKESVDLVRKGLEPTCDWFVADAESNYCFWKYMADRGDGRPLSTAKIAKLLMIDDAEVNRIVSKFKSQFADLISPTQDQNYSLIDGRSPEDE